MTHLRFFRLASVSLLIALVPITAVRAQRQAFEARHGIVTSAHYLASDAGLQMLKRGGNAVDAAVATGLALAVVYPFAGNLGGGGFMLIHCADGTDHIIDYREQAPAAATADMYVGPDGNVRHGPGSSTIGWRASGIPGTVAGLALALQKYGSGRLSWAEVCEPARRLAAEGHRVTPGSSAKMRDHATLLSQFPASKQIYLKDGAFWAAGENWKQPDLAATFVRLQQEGPREFYEGETARRIAAAMAANGGTITAQDLKNYHVVEREPLRGKYRGYEIVTMPPPSSGGIALLQMLAMLERTDVQVLGAESAAKYHLFAEVMRRAFCDRSEYLGDPDFTVIPVKQLLDPAYLLRRMSDFDAHRATSSERIRPGLDPAAPSTGPATESMQTTHFSIVDADGNAVANTYTLNGGFGSGVTIPDTGILMNNEMDDFTSKLGVKNMFGLVQGPRNAIAAGKRPLSSMTPTIVLKDGRLFLVTGSPGGPTIINTVLQIVTNVIDFKMPVMQAVEAPRVHHQWLPDVLTYERYGMSTDTANALVAMGHQVKERRSDEGAYQGDAETILVDPATALRLGAADPRSADAAAAGY